MRALIQRVTEANVTIDNKLHSHIDRGLLVLLGIEEEDTLEDVNWLLRKILGMRIFSDNEGKMNSDIVTIRGSLLVVSQFTLFASTKKGNRPSFVKAAIPEVAIPLYESFITLSQQLVKTESGVFGSDMKIALVNDGPVTIWLDSKNRE